MIEVQLNTAPKELIVSLDGNVLEYFSLTSQEDSARYHPGHFKSVDVTTDKKGKYWLEVQTKIRTLSAEVSDQALPKAKELVAAVQKAMKALNL